MRRGVSISIGMILILLAAALGLASTTVHASDGRIRTQSIRVPDSVRAGEPIHVSVGLRQADGLALHRVKTRAYIVDTGEMASGEEINRLRGRSQFSDMILETDRDTPPGEYLIRIYSSVKSNSDDTTQRRTKSVKHRWVIIE